MKIHCKEYKINVSVVTGSDSGKMLIPFIAGLRHSEIKPFPFWLILRIVRQNETYYLYFVCIHVPLFERHLAGTIFKPINLATCDRHSMTRLTLKKGNTQK